MLDSYVDPGTGARVRQLTNYSGVDDRYLCFTTDGWYDDGQRLLVSLRREGIRDLFSIDLETGNITQIIYIAHGVSGSTRVNERTEEFRITM